MSTATLSSSSVLVRSRPKVGLASVVLVGAGWMALPVTGSAFDVMETTIAEVHAAFKAGTLTSQQLVQMYLDRIAAYDKQGPRINSVIEINPQALADAAKLDAAFKTSGFVGPLHGIPVVMKDQMDAAGMRTTLGSVLLENYRPSRDSFVAAKLRAAGAILLAKVTLGELGGGDTYGSLFGESRNPYDLARTVGGSSGGTGSTIAANFATIGIGQEGFSSIRRPSALNSIVGMRPTAGLVSRGGVWAGWPSLNGSLGPMTRTVEDLARLLDVMVGYDPEDPITARGVGQTPDTYTSFLDRNGLRGARIGIIRESMAPSSDLASADYQNVDALFARAVEDLRKAGAVVIDNVVIPDVKALLARRYDGAAGDLAVDAYFARNAQDAPFHSNAEMFTPENIAKVPKLSTRRRSGGGGGGPSGGDPTKSPEERHYDSLVAKQELMTNLLKLLADHQLDALVHKTVEHTAGKIDEAINPPYRGTRGVIHINTFLVFASSMSVPAGFTPDGQAVGITFLGRPYAEPTLIKLGYAYEQATHHRKPPPTTPPLPRDS